MIRRYRKANEKIRRGKSIANVAESKRSVPKLRSSRGAQQITEFGAALFLLFTFAVIPLIDLCIIPVRYALAKSIVASRVHQLAQVDTISQALKAGRDESFVQQTFDRIGGVDVKSVTISLILEPLNHEEEKVIERAGSIPKDWLPNGKRHASSYLLNMKVGLDIHPLINVSLLRNKIPGLSTPIFLQLDESSAWENLACDPITEEFYVNE